MIDAELFRNREDFCIVSQIVVGFAEEVRVAVGSGSEAVIAVRKGVVERHLFGIVAFQVATCLFYFIQQVDHGLFSPSGELGA